MDTSKLETYTMEDPTDNDRGETVYTHGELSAYTLLSVLPPHINLRYILQHPKYRGQYVDAASVKIKRNKSYATLQKEYGPKMGDFVKVYRLPTVTEIPLGYPTPVSNDIVGEMGIVDDICPTRGVKINLTYYPFFILETLDKRDFEGKMCFVQNGPIAKEYKLLSIFINQGYTCALFDIDGKWSVFNINDVEFVKE